MNKYYREVYLEDVKLGDAVSISTPKEDYSYSAENVLLDRTALNVLNLEYPDINWGGKEDIWSLEVDFTEDKVNFYFGPYCIVSLCLSRLIVRLEDPLLRRAKSKKDIVNRYHNKQYLGRTLIMGVWPDGCKKHLLVPSMELINFLTSKKESLGRVPKKAYLKEGKEGFSLYTPKGFFNIDTQELRQYTDKMSFVD